MDKVDISTWKGSVRSLRYGRRYRKEIPVYSIFKVLFFETRCNHCEGDERGCCKHWCRTNYCSLVHIYCPVSILDNKFIERLDPNVTDIQYVEKALLIVKPVRPKYYRPTVIDTARENKIARGVDPVKIKIVPNGFRIRFK